MRAVFALLITGFAGAYFTERIRPIFPPGSNARMALLYSLSEWLRWPELWLGLASAVAAYFAFSRPWLRASCSSSRSRRWPRSPPR